MKGHALILLVFVAAGVLAYEMAERRSAPLQVEARASAEVSTERQDLTEQARQQLVEEQQTRARVAELERCEARQRERHELGVQQQQELSTLQRARQAAWTHVLQTNWPAYLELRKQAESSPRHTAPCTFCDGRGKMSFCIVCAGLGTCVRCGGTGRDGLGACAACLGTGKCYLCSGTGKMACMFCDDGDVYAKLPPPSGQIPLPRNNGARLLSQ